MGFLDRFSKDGRDARAREKNAQRAINKYAQSPDRLKALQALRDDGSDDALYALMRRFGMMYDKTIEDEQEKEWVFQWLIEKGEAVLPALKRYLLSADSISWPLRVLDKVVDAKEGRIDVIAAVLERHEPGYERDPTKKIQLLTHLAGLKHARVPALVAPYLGDMDEGVRYACVDALLKQGDETAARLPLLDLFAKEESLRLRIRIADGLAELGWSIADRRADVEKGLPEAFQVEARGPDVRIKKKPGAKE
jgi:HEAT repeat protein